jgi:predicted TIM-barrel fold metal-dependent hydrolase
MPLEEGVMAMSESPSIAKRTNVTRKLKNRKVELEAELKQVNATLELLEKHPDVQTVLDSLSELRIRL